MDAGKGMRGRVDVCKGRGESVLDYVIGNEEVWERVEDRVESNHFSVVD